MTLSIYSTLHFSFWPFFLNPFLGFKNKRPFSSSKKEIYTKEGENSPSLTFFCILKLYFFKVFRTIYAHLFNSCEYVSCSTAFHLLLRVLLCFVLAFPPWFSGYHYNLLSDIYKVGFKVFSILMIIIYPFLVRKTQENYLTLWSSVS